MIIIYCKKIENALNIYVHGLKIMNLRATVAVWIKYKNFNV